MQDVFPSGSWRPRKVVRNRASKNVLRIPSNQGAGSSRINRRVSSSDISFQRKSVRTRTPIKIVAPKSFAKKKSGHSVSDVSGYRRSLPAPPYIGRASSPVVSQVSSVPVSAPRPKKIKRVKREVVRNVVVSNISSSERDRIVVNSKKLAVEEKEEELPEKEEVGVLDQVIARESRDVPYSFQSGASLVGSGVATEKIILPRGWIDRVRRFLPSKDEMFSARGRSFAVNAALLVMGCLMLVGVVSQLRGVNGVLVAFDSVQFRAEKAYEKLLAAQAALADTDFRTSEQDFSDAEVLLHDAQVEMNNALASSQVVLEYVDVTGTVRSGKELLSAGESLTRAGQHVSRGVALLVPKKGASNNSFSLVHGLTSTQEQFVKAISELDEAEKSLGKVSSPLLPEDVAEQTAILEDSVPKIREALESFLDQGDALLTIIGAERKRQYLLLFQNSHEIRPTGGFIGSVGLVDVDKGEVENISVESVYHGDGQLRDYISPPDPLLPITNRWYMRDANWFVDYPLSAKKIAGFFEKEGGPTVDGVIAITPEVARELLAVTGPIYVPQYDVKVTYDNFWQVTQDQVSYSYDKELNRPKQFLSDLTPLLLNKLFDAPTDSALDILHSISKLVKEKNLLVYFRDESLQERFDSIGWSGSFPRDKRGLLAVNNANVAGHKSDQFIKQDIDYEMEVRSDGTVDVFVTIKRQHNGPTEAGSYEYPEGENPAKKDNVVYQRVLVPMGAELVSAEGFTHRSQVPSLVELDFDLPVEPDPDIVEWQRAQEEHESGTMIGREAGSAFFANWQITSPGETSVGLYHYRLPKYAGIPNVFDPADSFEAYVVKQPGDSRTDIRVSIELPEGMRVVHVAPRDGVTQLNEREIVYRGALRKDIMLGAVFERE